MSALERLVEWKANFQNGITLASETLEAKWLKKEELTSTQVKPRGLKAESLAITWKRSVFLATTEALNGEPEVVGETLRSKNEEKLKVDAAEPAAGKRILVKNQAEAKDNGIYEVIKAGKAGEKWEIKRTTDANTTAELQDAVVFVETGGGGSKQTSSVWVQTASVNTVGTTAQNWVGSRFTAEVQVITATKKWVNPTWAKTVTVHVIGGGGGGGSGSETAEKVGCAGGGGGSGASVNVFTFPASALPAEVECTIGKGGAGGANRTTEGTGENGKVGTASHFGEYLYAAPGEPGQGGVTNTGGNQGESPKGLYPGNPGGHGTGQGEGVGAAVLSGGAGGGGGGGGSTTTEAKKGGVGGHSLLGSETNAAAGAAGEAGKEGAYLTEEEYKSLGLPGHGGGGGGSGFGASAGAGGKGGKYGGGGGGGGGANKVGVTTGAGGAGGEGVIIVIAS